MSYVELHCHSAFSFLDGASLPDEIAAAAVSHGYEALALTDHNSVSGSMEFAISARALGLRPIHGAEVDLDDGRHLTLLVQDARGWAGLCRILTRAHAHTRERPGPPGLPSVPLGLVLEHAPGLVCLSGCARQGVDDERTLRRLRDAFGPEGLRIELQRPFLRDDRARNRRLRRLADRLGVRCVATGNVHAHARCRAPLQDAFVAIRLHSTLDASEPDRRGNFSHVMASPEAMAARFPEDPEAVAETARLAETLRFDLSSDLGYRYPGAEDAAAMGQLTELCGVRLLDRYQDTPGRVRAHAETRLREELRIIDVLGLPGFFLLHHDLLELAREVAVEVRGPESARALLPPGRGRGSSVSSIVCYLTGLSHVDPVTNELMIGRFLNEELTSLPDIDLDFPRDIRERLIPRIHERYGHERSALVAAFPTYRARGAIRELGKALGLPPGEIERVARGSEGWDAREVGRDIESAFGLVEEAGPDPPAALPAVQPLADLRHGPAPDPRDGELLPDPRGRSTSNLPRGRGTRWEWLARLAAEAHGLPRHLSQHSGGMIVATRPLIDCCPIVPAAMEGRQIVQWDKDSCSDAGFLKIDLLGLGMLSAVERAVEMIAHTRQERIDLSRIPYDDPETYECIQQADTTGVFQIESRAQMASLRRTRPETLQDITIQVAIVRPGPIQGGAVNPYIERRQRLREDPGYQVPYEHPSLEPVLAETLGTIIFQDQVLEVAIAFAGFSVGEAEGLRRAMSRKRSEAAIEAYHRRFVAGAQRVHGVEVELAERVFAMVQGFSGFGFPKAHGAAFGLLAYQSTWLRVHYGPELLCALLNEQPMGFYPPDALVHEAQRRGIVVLAPEVNHSGAECEIVPQPGIPSEPGVPPEPGVLPEPGVSPEAGPVRIGLGYVRGVREQDVRQLVAARERGGHFRSLADLASRAGAGSPALELLAWSGACDGLVEGGGSRARRIALWQLGVAAPGRKVPGGTQLALPLDLPTPPPLRTLSQWEAMLADYGSTGLTVHTHPLSLLRERLPAGAVSSAELERLAHGSRVQVGGLVVARQRPGTAKGIVFLLLEDEFGTINLIVPPEVYERRRLTVRTEPLMLATGRLEKLAAAGGVINILVSDVDSIAAPDRLLAEVKDFSLLDEQVRLGLAAQRAAAQAARNGDAAETEDFRAVAPAVMSFGSGRRR
ncbi:MAG TPA: DNA polymerase III subunit alpha [Solirubrobacteraceae bacterium]|nr:DNA polymerase III subunit alpha [Solirubrobacteraceae bacterium]